MNLIFTKYLTYIFILFIPAINSCVTTSLENQDYQEIIEILPAIDPFMIQSDSINYANWLGRKLPDGRSIIEPINLILSTNPLPTKRKQNNN